MKFRILYVYGIFRQNINAVLFFRIFQVQNKKKIPITVIISIWNISAEY